MLGGLLCRDLGTRTKPLDGGRQGVGELLALLSTSACGGLLFSGRACGGSPQLGHDALQLRDEQPDPLIAAAHIPQLALGTLARSPLEVDLATDLKGASLQLGKPHLQFSLADRSEIGQLGRRGLFGLSQLALNAIQLLGQLTRVMLARTQTAGEPVDL